MTTEYLTTEQLAERIQYEPRTILTRLKDEVMKEGVHYIRPFGRRAYSDEREHLFRPNVNTRFRNASRRVPFSSSVHVGSIRLAFFASILL